MPTDTCLVLLFKAPARSKRRLAAEIGPLAQTAAARLLECACADLADWLGPTCLAPAGPADADYARAHDYAAGMQIVQSDGNLGERISTLNVALLDAGLRRQLFIGSDCPALDGAYLAAASAALEHSDVVLGPAEDGGVVCMGVAGRWPALADLPWSSAQLGEALRSRCERANLRVALLDPRRDVDTAADLGSLPAHLGQDPRPSRRLLCDWIVSEPSL